MNHIEMLFSFIGGLGMFLYGMNIMADGLQKSAGNRMKRLLGFLTNNRLLAILMGTIITAIIQSSSATTVMVVGFVNAGILNLTQAVGVIMGANIGTTVTSWIVSMSEWGNMLKPEFFAPLLIGIGTFFILFSKKEKKKEAGEILVGFGVLFIGLSFMSEAIKPYRDAPVFANAFRTLGSNPFLGVLVGAMVTAVIQSSSASVGILQTIALNGVVTWNSAVYITLGQNIGTCITAIISSAGANRNAKRAAVIHLMFNVIGTVIFGILMFTIFQLKPEFAASNMNSVEISIFHTIFNVSNTLILFPFANLLVKASEKIIQGEDTAETSETVAAVRHLDERILETPSFAIENAVKEIVHMGYLAVEHFDLSTQALVKSSRKKVKKAYEMEKVINEMQKILTEYLVKLSNLSLTEKQHKVVNNLFYSVSDIERIGDHCDNIAELADVYIEKKLEFTDKALKGLDKIITAAREGVVNAIKARETGNVQYAEITLAREDDVDKLEDELRSSHIKRLAKKQCSAEPGIIFLDTISNLERISDHATNIAEYIQDESILK